MKHVKWLDMTGSSCGKCDGGGGCNCHRQGRYVFIKYSSSYCTCSEQHT